MFTPLHYIIGAGGLALGIALAGTGSAAWDKYVDDPAVVRETKAVCLSDIETAASRARLEQWRRNQEVIDNLNRQFAEQERQRAAEQAQINREIEDDITEFEAAGRSQCTVTADSLEWLQPKSAGNAGR